MLQGCAWLLNHDDISTILISSKDGILDKPFSEHSDQILVVVHILHKIITTLNGLVIPHRILTPFK